MDIYFINKRIRNNQFKNNKIHYLCCFTFVYDVQYYFFSNWINTIYLFTEIHLWKKKLILEESSFEIKNLLLFILCYCLFSENYIYAINTLYALHLGQKIISRVNLGVIVDTFNVKLPLKNTLSVKNLVKLAYFLNTMLEVQLLLCN